MSQSHILNLQTKRQTKPTRPEKFASAFQIRVCTPKPVLVLGTLKEAEPDTKIQRDTKAFDPYISRVHHGFVRFGQS